MNRKRIVASAGSPIGRWTLWFGAFAFLAVIDALQMYAGQRFEDFAISLPLALRRGLESWMPCSVLGLGVLWVAGRHALQGEHWGRWLAKHFGFSLLYTLSFGLVHSALLDGQRSVRGSLFEFWPLFRKILIFYSATTIGTYWLMLLGHHGWIFYRCFRERERRAAELEGQLARARLEALRMQLNPHFLFNTLNTVAALVHEQPHTAERMVTRLSDLLRASLDHSDAHEVSLQEELELLHRYLDIEQTRFSDRLRVSVEAGPDVAEALVPSLVFQPLVENAIRHGVEPRETEGRIEVRAERIGSRLRLSVRDNGAGPGAANDATPTRRGSGIGMANTRSRLEHLYGRDQSCVLRARPEGGAEVIVEIPFRTVGMPLPTEAVS